jgi:uncharacterized membrane protein YdjX (TVP38/TMEM64 family)
MSKTELAPETVDTATRKLWGKVVFRVAVGGLILLTLIWIGQDAGKEIKALEAWIGDLGILAPLVFVGAVVILTSIFFPATLLAAVAGALFGLGWGTLTMVAGSIIGAALNYLIANKLFRKRINSTLQRHPKFLAIQRAVKQEGVRLQFMLRLTPINSAMVNYLLGATGVRFSPYLVATVGLLPGLFMEVYFGHVAKHVTKTAAHVSSHSTMHLVLTIGGFLVCVAIMICITRMAQRALAKAQLDSNSSQ